MRSWTGLLGPAQRPPALMPLHPVLPSSFIPPHIVTEHLNCAGLWAKVGDTAMNKTDRQTDRQVCSSLTKVPVQWGVSQKTRKQVLRRQQAGSLWLFKKGECGRPAVGPVGGDPKDAWEPPVCRARPGARPLPTSRPPAPLPPGHAGLSPPTPRGPLHLKPLAQ